MESLEQIQKLLHDPGLLFTQVLTIGVSVISGLLVLWIDRLIRWIIRIIRGSRRTSRFLDEAGLLADPALLTAHNFQTVIQWLKFIAMLLLFAALIAYVNFAWLSRSKYERSDPTFLTTVVPFVYLGFWVACLWLGGKASFYAAISGTPTEHYESDT